MKKLFLLFTVLCSTAGSSAQPVFEAPKESNGTETYEYYLVNSRNSDYYVTTTTGVNGGAQQLGSANSFNANKVKVRFKLKADGKLYATNVGETELIVGYTGTGEAANSVRLFASDNSYTWNIEEVADQQNVYTINAGESTNSWNMHGGAGNNIGLYRGTDGGSTWYFEKVETVSATVNYYDGEEQFSTKTISVAKGYDLQPYEIPAPYFFVNESLAESIAPTENFECRVNCTPNFPFEFVTIEDGQFTNDAFYTLTIENQGTRPVVYVGEGSSPVHTKIGTQVLTKGNLWAIKHVGGYKVEIYNLAVGASSPMKAKSKNDVAVSFNTTDANYVSQFVIMKNGDGCVFHCTPGDRDLNACINVSAANTGLGTWGNGHNDAGSTFYLKSLVDYLEAYIEQEELTLDASYSSDDYAYTSTMQIPSDLKTAIDNYNSAQNGETTVALIDAITANPEYQPGYPNNLSSDKFYQLISYNDINCKGKAVYSISGCGKDGGKGKHFDRQLFIETQVGQQSIAETAFTFTEVSGGYKITHANSDYYFAYMSAFNDMQNPDLPIASYGTMVLENQRGKSNVWSIRGSDNTEKYFHCGTGNQNTIVRQQSPATNDGNLWLIKEIKNIPVTVGEAKWATLCLPMAVVVPNDATLKVYYVAAVESNNLILEEVAAGTVLAKKQPVLLYSTSENTSDTYNFAVTTEEGTTLANNILTGSTARRGLFSTEASEYYALGMKEETVGFYPSLSEKIAANKAYILNSSLPSLSRGFYFSFGNETGIEQVDVEEKDVIYYDLKGRQVFYPSKGVFITNTGKKVFIK